MQDLTKTHVLKDLFEEVSRGTRRKTHKEFTLKFQFHFKNRPTKKFPMSVAPMSR